MRTSSVVASHLSLFHEQSKCCNSAKSACEMLYKYKVRSIQWFYGIQSTENKFKLVMAFHSSLKYAVVSMLCSKHTAEATSSTLPGPPV